MLRNFSLYSRLISVQLRSQMTYRLSFLMEVITTAVITFMFFGSLALVFGRFQSLGGWTLGEIAFLWGLVEFSFGAMDLVFSGFDPQNFGQMVRLGSFDQMLLRPINTTTQVLGSRFVLRRLGRMAQGVAIFGIALWLVPIDWTVTKVVYLPLVVVGLVCFFGGLFVIGATVSFWTVESLEAMNMFTYGGSEMIAYPMHIYPAWMRWAYTYIIPAIFLNYYPALYFLDKPDPLGMPQFVQFLSPIIGIGILLIGLQFWRFGIRHYQSTGS